MKEVHIVLPLGTYVDAALAGDRATCLAIARAQLDAGMPIRRLYLDLFQAAQREVGERWARSAISVGTEHRATATTQAVIAALYEEILTQGGHGTKVVLACVGPEKHEVGPRMVADFAEMAGYDVAYLGQVPDPARLVDRVREERPALIGLSATIPAHLPAIGRFVQALRDALGAACPRIVVGGRAFAHAPEAWRALGADGFAADAEDAVAAFDGLARSA